MDGLQRESWVTANGRMMVDDFADMVLASKCKHELQVVARRSRYTWAPPPEIAEKLPHGFSLSLDSLTGMDGVRRFVPALPTPDFILQASLGGSALLGLKAGLSAEQRYSYHAMRLIYQQAPRLREHLDRSFHREQDLYIPRAGRIGQEDKHILPDDLGLDAGGHGHPWNPRELIAEGRAAALAEGTSSPVEADSIRLGLTVAARRRPFKLTSLSRTASLQLVRLALFDLGPSTGPIQATEVETIEERLLSALNQHLGDDPGSFDQWFFGSLDNLVHRIAKKKRGGGTLSREVVRQAHLEMVFRAHTYMGDCVHLQMVEFSRALPEPLTSEEQALFDSIYTKETRLGGLPLILLRDRFDFVREAVLDILERPQDRRRVGVLLRLLQYYGDMTRKRREGDRRYKQQGLHRNNRNRCALVLPLNQEQDASEMEPDRFQEIAAALREQQGETCRCGTTRHWRARLIAKKTTPSEIVLEDGCGNCDALKLVKILVKRFTEIGKSLMPDWDDR